jgi:peptide/nickel transport system permease protein
MNQVLTENGYKELAEIPSTKRIKLSRFGKVGLVIVMFWLVIALVGPFVAPYHEADLIADDSYLPASSQFILGSDYLGRDILSRILWGTRTTIGISLAATFIAYFTGITLGIAAAAYSGWIDMGLSRVNDVFLALPNIMLALIVIAAFGSSIPILIVTAGLVYSSGVFRVARALGQEIAVEAYVSVARARGEGAWWIISREIWPNIIMPLITDFGFRLVFIILFISSLSFMGLGVQPPMSDWGSMVRENMQGLSYGSLASVWPALAIATLTISLNLVVDDVSAQIGGDLAKKI